MKKKIYILALLILAASSYYYVDKNFFMKDRVFRHNSWCSKSSSPFGDFLDSENLVFKGDTMIYYYDSGRNDTMIFKWQYWSDMKVYDPKTDQCYMYDMKGASWVSYLQKDISSLFGKDKDVVKGKRSDSFLGKNLTFVILLNTPAYTVQKIIVEQHECEGRTGRGKEVFYQVYNKKEKELSDYLTLIELRRNASKFELTETEIGLFATDCHTPVKRDMKSDSLTKLFEIAYNARNTSFFDSICNLLDKKLIIARDSWILAYDHVDEPNKITSIGYLKRSYSEIDRFPELHNINEICIANLDSIYIGHEILSLNDFKARMNSCTFRNSISWNKRMAFSVSAWILDDNAAYKPSWKVIFTCYHEILKLIQSARDKNAMGKYGQSFHHLNFEEKRKIEEMIPLRIAFLFDMECRKQLQLPELY